MDVVGQMINTVSTDASIPQRFSPKTARFVLLAKMKLNQVFLLGILFSVLFAFADAAKPKTKQSVAQPKAISNRKKKR